MVELHESEVFSLLGSITGDPDSEGFVHRFDAVEFEGYVCLVATWLEAIDGKHKVPERIVRLPQTMLQAADGLGDIRYTIVGPIPTSVLQGTVSSPQDYTVIERPNIRVQLGSH